MNLSNKEIEKSLNDVLQNIQNSVINDNDEDIEEYLIPDFDKLQYDDKVLFIKYISKHYSKYQFIKHKRFQNLQKQVENYKELFQQLIKQKDWNQVVEKFKVQDFCKENNIPDFWGTDESIKAISNNKEIIPTLIELIEINDYQQGYNYLNQILIYFQLLSYTFYYDQEQKKQTIEKIIGSSLGKQILQYYEYKGILELTKPKEYKELMEVIRLTQLQSLSNYEFSQLDSYHQVCYIVQTKLIDKKCLENYLKRLFKISEQQIDFKRLEKQVLKLIFLSNKIQELYFILMFYFLNQYCSSLDFQDELLLLEQKISERKENQVKEDFINLHCQKKMNKQNSIYQFLLSQLTYLTKPLYNQFLEEYQIYKGNQQENEKQLSKLELNTQIFKSSYKEAKISLNQMKKVPLITISKIQQDQGRTEAFTLIHCLLFRENQQIIFELVASSEKDDLNQCSQKLLGKQFLNSQSIIYLFLLIGIVNKQTQNNLQYFMNLYFYDNKFSNAEFVQNICYLINWIQQNQKLDNETIQKLSNSNKGWEIIDKLFDKQEIVDIYENIFEFYLNSYFDEKNKQFISFIYQMLQNFGKHAQQPIQVLVQQINQEDFDVLFQSIILQTQNVQSDVFDKISRIIFLLLEKIKSDIQQQLLEYLNAKSKNKIFNFMFVKEQIKNGKNLKFIQYSQALQFYQTRNDRIKLIKKCKSLFKDDQNIYQMIFDELKQSNIFQITPEYLRNSEKIESLPRNADIGLEDFNISLQEMSENDKQKLINDWFENMKNTDTFKKLIPFYFNIIKRKESSKSLLFQLNKNDIQKKQAFNMKAMFQILYNNSNFELKQILLKLWSEINPLPLLFSNPNIDEAKNSLDLFSLNKQLNFLFPECFLIINFSLSKKQNQYGKTSLINQVFYECEKFEENDNCQLNQNTIDIMFDFCFSGSRNFAIADVHGIIPLEIMIKILPLFNFCIIQMDSEDELQENYESFKDIKSKLQYWNPECCFIIRNSKTKDNKQMSQLEINKQMSQLEKDVKSQKIIIHKMIDLTQKRLNKQQINLEINQFSQFIFDVINKSYYEQFSIKNSQDYLVLLQNYYGDADPEIQQIQKHDKLLNLLMEELKKFIKDEKGFYSLNAFPMRALMWQIKNLKQKQYQFDGLNRDEQIKQVESIKKQISNLEQQIPSSKPTYILKLFQQIFDSKGYYNLYLKFADQLRKFNEQHIYKLQEANQEINEDLLKQKQENKQSQNQNMIEINNSIKKQKEQLEQNIKIIELRNIGIELFWREIIQIKQKGQSAELKINPAKIITDMVKKGEPFEFLDGDQLQIDTKFLQEFIKNFHDPDEKVLILSVLGPQSSGKSTILNKMFGCHFWTSVGRCTKGIYLQLLKITQKEQFDNQFDYVLILDTEGLQNPNQNDPEFDKKIALFILAISDIIIINVKGDIHQQFKNLVEMCIFTLGQMKSSLQSVKQLNWCFNQNNDCKNFAPFLDQIQSIVNNLHLQINQAGDEGDNSNFDYNEVLDLKKENIKILGFATTEYTQRINFNTEWRQLILNETFSQEAYNFGLQMIQQFVIKLKTQKEYSLPTLSSFVQNVESHWQSICRLPDLLEFTELIQYKQDQSMKKMYEELLSKQYFNYETQIPKKIYELVFVEKNKSLEFFKKLENDEKQFIQQEIQKIKQDIENELQKYKTENKILTKIFKKYKKQLEDYLQTQEYDCHLILIDEIKKYEREFQERKGFTYIEDLIEKISQNEQELQNLKGNKVLIQKQFNQVWSKIISEAKEQQEQVFQDYSQASYKAIYSSFIQYQYNTQNQEQFIAFFLELSKTSPIQKNYNEKQKIFNKYIQEIQSQQQFQIISNNNQNIKYYDIFCQPLIDKMKRCDNNYVVDLNNFYSYESVFKLINLKDFKQYLLSDLFYNDFDQFKKKKESNYQNSDKEKMINQVLREFRCILDYCQIIYNKEKLAGLKQYLTEGNKWYQFGDNFKTYFNDFQQTIELRGNFNQIVQQPEFTRNIPYYYPSLKLNQIDFCYNNSQEYQKKIENYNQNVLFLLSSKFQVKQQDHFETFSYIADQKANSNLLQKFNSQIVKQFQEIMIKCEGWQRVYSEIYDIIKSKMIKLKNTNENKQVESDSENEETLTSDTFLVKQIMAIIEQKILEYNKQFANFGIILTSIGERLIYYYSMFVIWRFSCYSKWKLIERNLQQLDQMKDEQLNRFIIAIEQNTTEQSISNAQVIAKSIKPGFLNRFYSTQQPKIKKSIDSFEQKCSDYVKGLDQKLLENYQNYGYQSNRKDQEIQEYILDQKGYIVKSVDKLIKEKEDELKKDYELLLRSELTIFLKQVFKNISFIYNITKQQSEIQKSQNYFECDDDNSNQEDCDRKLFFLVCKCIQGEQLTNEQRKNIRKAQMEIFNQKYEFIQNPIFVKLFNDSEKRISLLKPFIQELHKLIELEIQNCSKEPINLNNLQIQGPFNKIKLSLVGCLHSCPLCNRKCDQQSDSNHKHSCSNGHQLRGMNGILINNKPSLYTCEEIEDNSLIQTSDSTIQKKWSDIKKAYPEWNFKDLNDQKVIQLKERMMNIWNSGIGQLVCQQLSQKLNTNIQFSKKTDFNQDKSQSIHYILMLDDSGSMDGQVWENAKNGALQCMKDIGKNGEAKVSVIIFNSNARVVIDCERVDVDRQKNLFEYKSGGTSFNNAFLKAYDQLYKHINKKFDKNIILFYTDGQDSYPADAVKKFCSLNQQIKLTLQLVSCAEGNLNQIASLVQLTDNFNKSGISAELKSNINVNNLQTVWAEVVNQNYHNIRF